MTEGRIWWVATLLWFLMRCDLHSLGHLNTSLPVGSTVWRGLGGVTMLKEVGHQESLLKLKSLACSLLLLLDFNRRRQLSASCSYDHTCWLLSCCPCPGNSNPLDYKPKQTLIPLNCLGPDWIFCLLALLCFCLVFLFGSWCFVAEIQK